MTEDRLQGLFLELVELAPAERGLRLAEVAAEDPELARELELLLRHPSEAPSPIDDSPWRLARAAGGAAPVTPSPPERVGRYRLLRELGRGGMGRVYLAEEATPDFRRSVAVKLIEDPGPGDAAIRRFREEVRILASLEHPGIARFLDGGRSPEGIWFLALEYVDGRDLVSYADASQLAPRARVELFAAAVEAVAYAHARGVVHRDLKPSNLLVGNDGRPRLLDFGISKATGDEARNVTTLPGWQPLTPAYASPEQLAGAPATPRSDVYALGVVLHELLTGARPPAEGPAETPGRRFRGLDRDFAPILVRALARDPAARQADASELLAELRDYLAHPATTATAWKGSLGRRTGGPVAWPAILAVALVAAFLVALALFVARHDDAPELRANASRRSTLFPFDTTNPPAAEASERRLAEAPEDFEAAAALVLRLGRDRKLDEARIALERMQQVPESASEPLVDYAAGRLAGFAGEDQRALVYLTRARDRALATRRGELVATFRISRAAVLSKLGQRDAAYAELEAARDDAARSGDQATLYRAWNGLALELLERGEMDRGETALAAALAAADAAGIEPVHTLYDLAVVRAVRGRPDLSEPLLHRLIALTDGRGDPLDGAEARKTLGQVLRDLGRTAEAAPVLQQALAALRAAGDPRSLADALFALASAGLEDGQREVAATHAEELQALGRSDFKRLPLAYAHWLRARLAALAGDPEAARRDFAEARRLLLAEGMRDLAALAEVEWAEAEARAGEAAAAERLLHEAMARLDQPADTPAGFRAMALHARLAAGAGRVDEARRLLDAAGKDAERAPNVFRRIAYLEARASLAVAERRVEDARRDLATARALALQCGFETEALELRLAEATVAASSSEALDRLNEVVRRANAIGWRELATRAERTRAALSSRAL